MENLNTPTAGNIIKQYREAKGLSRSQLAERTKNQSNPKGLSKMAIYLVETGQRSPTERTLRAIAEALGIPAAVLLA